MHVVGHKLPLSKSIFRLSLARQFYIKGLDIFTEFAVSMTQSAESPRIILASTSPYRKKQLESWGLPFAAVKPTCNEEDLKTSFHGSPQELCRHLAEAKAQSIAQLHPEALVIGSDQIAVAPSGVVLDKPGSNAKAAAQLRQLSGHTHSLITGLAVIYLGQTFRAHEVIEVTLRDLTVEEIAAYVAQDDPWDCAGAYKLEQLGICLVKEIKGRDPSSIQGLPMMALSEAFLELLGALPFQLKHRLPLINTGESHD